MTMIYLWIAVIVLSAASEAATLTLVSIWFIPSAVIALVLAMFSVDIWIQVLLFFVLSIILLLTTRRFAMRCIVKKQTPTNADRIIGMNGIVTEEIDTIKQTGQVHVDGQLWSARGTTDVPNIKKDTVVRIERIEGVKVIVTPVSEESVDIKLNQNENAVQTDTANIDQ